MKKIFGTILLHLFCAVPFSVFSKSVVKGNVSNCNGCQIVFILDVETVGPFLGLIDVSPLPDGRFIYPFDIKKPTVVFMQGERSTLPIYLEPGAELSIRFSYNDPSNTITYTSGTAAENRHLKKLYSFFGWQGQKDPVYRYMNGAGLAIKNDKYFKIMHDKDATTYANYLKVLNSATSALAGLSPSYTDYIGQYIKYKKLALEIINPLNENYSSEKVTNLQTEIERRGWSPIANEIPTYLPFLKAIVLREKTKRNADISSVAGYKQLVNSISYLPPPAKEHLLYHKFYSALKPGNVNLLEPEIRAFTATMTNLEERARLESRIAEARKFMHGTKAPEFSLFDIAGRRVSNDVLRGKYVYISFWANWCKPCIEGMQKSIPVKQKLGRSDIEFVYISLEGNYDDWKKSNWTKIIKGQHTWAGQGSKVSKDYEVFALPSYFMLDKQGNFIAEFPSADSEEFVQFANSLP